MKLVKQIVAGLAVVLGLALITGCETTGSNVYGAGGKSPASSVPAYKFKVGDLVIVTFSGVEPSIPQHEERIKEDGTITLSLIGSIKADGKTPGQLQKDIRDKYVPGLYTESLNITVKAQDRFFYVGGEVKSNGRYPWVEGMTVVKAIQNAGGLTDYAKASKVRVTREQKTFTVNYTKALENPSLDVPVYPDDTINVPRRGL